MGAEVLTDRISADRKAWFKAVQKYSGCTSWIEECQLYIFILSQSFVEAIYIEPFVNTSTNSYSHDPTPIYIVVSYAFNNCALLKFPWSKLCFGPVTSSVLYATIVQNMYCFAYHFVTTYSLLLYFIIDILQLAKYILSSMYSTSTYMFYV